MIVVDASVAIKWVLEEKGSKAARALMYADEIVAPNLIMLECANALWSKVRSKLLSRAAATLGLTKIANAPMRLRTETDIIDAAQAIAFEIDRTVYDSVYLAIAIADNGVLVTADERFAAAAEAHPVYRSFIRQLGA